HDGARSAAGAHDRRRRLCRARRARRGAPPGSAPGRAGAAVVLDRLRGLRRLHRRAMLFACAAAMTMADSRQAMRRAALVFLLLAVAPARAQHPKPALVVVLVSDQMRADYLTRYGAEFQHGLKTLMASGAWYQDAAYPYFNTVTCAGHSTIGTGDLPFHHGMIGNSWFNRETGKTQTCSEAHRTGEVPYGRIPRLPAEALAQFGESAKWMLTPTLAETLRKTMKSRVATMSIKARSAIGLAGHEGDFVTWLDERGAWTTSSAF